MIYSIKAMIPYFDDYTDKVDYEKSPYRIIAMPSSTNLHQLAKIVTESFDFDFDHLFAYFDDFRNPWESDKAIENNFKKITIDSIFTRKGKKWLFLYDFGDEWHFYLSLEDVFSDDDVKAYPKIIETKGEAPEQYETYEDDDSENLTFTTLDGKVVKVNFIDENEWQQIEHEIQAEVDKKIDNNELEYSTWNLKIYANYLNRCLDFPFKAIFLQDYGMFGEVETKIEVHAILDSPKKLRGGLKCECGSVQKKVEIPLLKLKVCEKGKNNDLIERYKAWYRLHH